MNGLPVSCTEKTIEDCIRKQKRRFFRTGAFLFCVMLLSAALSVRFGSAPLPWAKIAPVLLGRDAESVEARIILYSRLPRTLGCLCCGASLAASGAVIQSVLENPLAAPNLIGINAGAGLAVALNGALFPGAAALTPFAAFLGALAGAFTVLLIGESTGASRLTVILSGIAVSSAFSGLLDLTLTLAPDALSAYADFRIGGFSGVVMRRIIPACIVSALSLALVLSLTPQMDILSLGADYAQSLGLRVRPVRILLLSAAAALAGAAVSVSGLLGFVGLIVPHAARRAAHGESLPLILFSAFGGAAFVTLCDLFGRVAFAPYEVPAGVILSLLGGPFFLWLVLRRRRNDYA
ncbi:MAG: iron ABC transporter permease [Oscillibacter sp.]|nr:iron ABC transporter permease [Oscillibacter sp.]